MNCNKVLTNIATILLAVLVLLEGCPIALSQNESTFTPIDKYLIPGQNAVISFAFSGTYEKATLENGTWSFSDLLLNNSQVLENLSFSAQNSNVTISYIRITNTTYWRAQLRYVVEGQGKQTVNLGLVPKNYEWTVVSNGVYMEKGSGWTIGPDLTLTINGATKNVTISCYDFVDSIRGIGNTTFYEQHSVAIISIVIVGMLVVLAVTVRSNNKKHID